MTTIANSELREEHLPQSFDQWEKFALTYDGYAEHGDQCAEIANRKSPRTLSEYRACLFFEQRRWRHLNLNPDPEAADYIRSLVDGIRALVRAAPSDETPRTLSLKQIAAWELPQLDAPCEIRASVPALQRGLVWNPQQVELLWDSILRGFPIGSLVVCEKVNHQERGLAQNITHHLLDGQQRCNAITLGFYDPFDAQPPEFHSNKSESILWIDLAPNRRAEFSYPQIPHDSTRQFLIRVTTRAHPWGYRADDNAKRLSASDIRECLEWEFEDRAAPKVRPSPRELFPWFSNAPVPLSWLLSAIQDEQGAFRSERNFWAIVKQRLDRLRGERRWAELTAKTLEENHGLPDMPSVYRGICRALRSYMVILSAPSQDFTNSSLEPVRIPFSWSHVANIEQLFNRLNRLGSPLSGEELAFSMIKAYWPRLGSVIEDVSIGRLPSSQLASLGIRVALTPNQNRKLARAISVDRLRLIARSDQTVEMSGHAGSEQDRHRIEHFVGMTLAEQAAPDTKMPNRLASACAVVDRWLLFSPKNPSGLPPVLVSSFARSCPDCYLFLLHLADRIDDGASIAASKWHNLLPALATLVLWFAEEEGKLAIADALLESISEGVSPENVRLGLMGALRSGKFTTPQSPLAVKTLLQFPDDDRLARWSWDFLFERANESERMEKEAIWGPFLRKTAWQRELLLYAQRAYLSDKFQEYDPSRKDLWEAHNRPWDFDHLHASAYFHNAKSGDYADLCRAWGNCIGNLRAWPFEENRSDQKKPAKEKIDCRSANPNNSLNDSFILSEEELSAFSLGDEARRTPQAARTLCEAIKARYIRIYEEWYVSTGIKDLTADEPS